MSRKIRWIPASPRMGQSVAASAPAVPGLPLTETLMYGGLILAGLAFLWAAMSNGE